jgi:hypothetical protein
METQFADQYEELSPEAVRKIAVMECLLFAFIEHAVDLSLIDKMEKQLNDLVVGHRSADNLM